MTDDLTVWLGPALDDLTPEQVERVTAEATRIHARYPHPDRQPERDAALSAAVQYLLGETTAEEAGRTLGEARARVLAPLAASRQIALMLVDDGISEADAARTTAIDRMTLRKDRGKR